MIIIVCLFLSLAVSAAAEPLRSTGMTTPYQQVELAASSDGVVTEVLVKEGESVTNDQVLARLDSAREALEVRRTFCVRRNASRPKRIRHAPDKLRICTARRMPVAFYKVVSL